MKKSDLMIILCVVVVSVILLLLPIKKMTTAKRPASTLPIQTNASAIPQKMIGQATPVAGSISPTPVPILEPAKCYLLVTIGDLVFAPYPLVKEQDLPITQADGKQNVVHIFPDGFYMATATCDNQDCVHQGKVTLDNRDVRLLGNQVVCLPNQVVLELLTPEEAQVVWNNAYGDGEK